VGDHIFITLVKLYAIIVNILILSRFWWYSQMYQYILRTWYDSYFCILSILGLRSVVFSVYLVYLLQKRAFDFNVCCDIQRSVDLIWQHA